MTKRPIAKTTATTIVQMTCLRLIESVSSPAFSADHDSARNPSVSDSRRTKTPRMNGDLRSLGTAGHAREARGVCASMTPSGRRTATAQASGARIITPSMTACPPTLAPGGRLNQDSSSEESPLSASVIPVSMPAFA